jgi:hypothetical protein
MSQDKLEYNAYFIQNYVGDLRHKHNSGLSHIETITSWDKKYSHTHSGECLAQVSQ